MDFIKNLFSSQPPSESDMINYALGRLKLPYKSDAIRESLQKKYPNLQQVEISQLEPKCSQIFSFCINIPANDDTYDEQVKTRYPFLSAGVLGSIKGKAFLIQERGGG
jgi:hypothetical protein